MRSSILQSYLVYQFNLYIPFKEIEDNVRIIRVEVT